MDTAGSRRGGIERPPQALQRALECALGAPVTCTADASELPKQPGAYVVLARLDEGLKLPIPRFAGQVLVPGWYLYAGSAHGPGGIAARAGRHLKRSKPVRWHIDHLTAAAAAVWSAALPQSSECAIAQALVMAPEIAVPIAGFGSTDCRQCTAHLLKFAGPVRRPSR